MFANSHKCGQRFNENILKTHLLAKQRRLDFPDVKVVDGTVGAIIDAGELVTFPTVDKLLPTINVKTYSAYSSMQGNADYLNSIKALCFENYLPARNIGTVAVAGGNSGIHHAVNNYTEPGDIILTSDWYWASYEAIIRENRRKLGFFKFFRDRSFCLDSFQESVDSLAKLQENIFIILNTPGHNPTGYTIDSNEWDEIIACLNSVKRRIILFLDLAYLEYAPVEYKKFFQQLDKLNSNVLVLAAYSISKGLAKYGLRTAALFALHEDAEIIDEFENIIAITNQSTYACVPSLGQHLTTALCCNEKALATYLAEKNEWVMRLRKRADIFLAAIDEYLVTPYRHGFFISIKTRDADKLVEKLKKENIFLVPVTGGVRVAICSVSEDDLESVATAVMRHI